MAKFVTKPNNSNSSGCYDPLVAGGLILFIALLTVFAMILCPLSYCTYSFLCTLVIAYDNMCNLDQMQAAEEEEEELPLPEPFNKIWQSRNHKREECH